VQAITGSRSFRIGDFVLDAESGELRRNGEKSRLAEQPLQILLLLLEHRDQLVSRDDLRQRLWPADTFVDFETGLNRAVRKLRDALGDSADTPSYIETVPKRGYRLIAEVGEPRREPAAVPTQRRTLRWIGIAAAVVIAVLVIIATARSYSRRQPPIHSIAVLPLANLSGDPSQEYFADAMTEALITDLAQLRNVTVISRTSVMAYKRSPKSLPQIARDLSVDGVVEGGVLRAGGRVRVTAQLIHAPTDHHVWARSYERNESDVVTLQRELAASITEALRAELSPEARARLHTDAQIDPVAYELFLKGMTAAGKENTQGFTEAIAYLSKAVERQPDFAPAYVEMALCYSQFAWNGAVAPSEFMGKARAAALKALAIDPASADAHVAMGAVFYQYDWDWSRSEQEFRRALELNPNHAHGHSAYAALLRITGRREQAKAELARVSALDPLNAKKPAAIVAAAIGLRRQKNYDQAIAEMRKALQMDPAVARAHAQLGLTLFAAGQQDEGINELETAVRLAQKNRRFQANLGWAYAVSGRTADARRILEALEQRARQEYVSPVAIAMVHAGLRENDQALHWLEQAYEQRDFDLVFAQRWLAFESLRREPRFQELMRRIGLPEA